MRLHLPESWKSFLPWLETRQREDLIHMEETLEVIGNLCDDARQAAFQKVLENKSCARTLRQFELYLDYLRRESGSLSTFWMSYVDTVEDLLGLLRTSREADWMLHLASI